jgi:hypothetical protein
MKQSAECTTKDNKQMPNTLRETEIWVFRKQMFTYCSANGEDGHCDLGNVLPVPQVHIWDAISNTGFLEPVTVDGTLQACVTHWNISNPFHVTNETNRIKSKLPA